MYRSSPSYSPPAGRGRSQSYSPPRACHVSPVRVGSSMDRCGVSPGGVSPPRALYRDRLVLSNRSPTGGNGRTRSRSRSPMQMKVINRGRRSRSKDRSRLSMSRDRRSRSRSPTSMPGLRNYYPWQDTSRFDSKDYDYGEVKYREKEQHCEICDVWTRSMDQMQAHRDGANHKKKSANVQRFSCSLCLIEVPCQDTLNNHMRGKNHLKRLMQWQEQSRDRGDVEENAKVGYKTGPREMAKLSNSQMVELEQLRYTAKVLQDKVKQYRAKEVKCVIEHGTQEVKELREYKKWCQEEHIRSKEFDRKEIFCKREEGEDDHGQTSTSSRVEQEMVVKREGARREYIGEEYVEREVGGEIVNE